MFRCQQQKADAEACREIHELEHAEHGVDVPTLGRGEALGRKRDFGRHAELELVVGRLEERQELSDHDAHVGLVREGVAELERSPADRDVTISEAVEDDGPMALDGVGVDGDDLVESVESDVAEGPGT